MKSLMEKAENMMASILEMLDVDSASSDSAEPALDDELARDNELNSDTHHKLIELCW